jgi:hypothetical protein
MALSTDPRSEARKPVTVAARWGQVPTPEPIALKMAHRLLRDRVADTVRILDPCVGPTTFPKALVRAGVLRTNDELMLMDIDHSMLTQSAAWLQEQGITFSAECGDYIETKLLGEYDYAILNPPYVRQEWLERKEEYGTWFRERYGLRVPGTSNQYVYFVAKVLKELRPGGRLACIVYDSWQSTRFGAWLADILEQECAWVAIEAEPNQPFNGHLIDATVIYAEKCGRRKSGTLCASTGGRVRTGPLSSVPGFCLITDAFQTRRGLRLKQADFFLCDSKTAAKCGATPFVKKVTKLSGYEVPEDHPEAALLVGPVDRNPAVTAELRRRLKQALQAPEDNVSILTWFSERPESWMLHRPAPYAGIVFNYYIRRRPKHILNLSHAYSDNFYGLTPREGIPVPAWLAVLNSTASCIEILSTARNQGNGLAKVQLFEYRKAYIPNLRQCSRRDIRKFEQLGGALVSGTDPQATIKRIDEAVAAVFADSRLRSPTLYDIFAEVDEKARKPRDTAECLG